MMYFLFSLALTVAQGGYYAPAPTPTAPDLVPAKTISVDVVPEVIDAAVERVDIFKLNSPPAPTVGVQADVSEPVDIRVIGNRVRARGDAEVIAEQAPASGRVETATDLQLFVEDRTARDMQIQEVRMSDDMVAVAYTMPGRLFGFIPLTLRYYIDVSLADDSYGRVTVQAPWFRILFSDTVDAGALMNDIEEALDLTLPKAPSAVEARVQTQSRVFTTVSNILKTKHDTAMNAIRNMK